MSDKSTIDPALRGYSAFSNRPVTRLMAGLVVAAMVATFSMVKDGGFVFLATGLWALAIVFLPAAVRRDYDLFSIWSFVVLTVFIGVTLRGVCLTLSHPDDERLGQLYLLGREPGFFIGPAVLLLVGLLMLSIGYVARSPKGRTFRPIGPDPGRTAVVCLGLLGISTVATMLYLQETGGWESGDWSGKRAVIPDLDLAGADYQSHGDLRFLASLAIFGHALALAMALGRKALGRFGSGPWWILAIVLLLVAGVVPFHASLRTTVALQLCVPAAMIYYSGRRFPLAAAAGIGVTAMLAIYVMTALRPVSDDREADLAAPTIARLFDAAVINRNQIELPKTAHIVAAVPEELPPQYGKTLLRWALAPIPRNLWPDKPVIPPGPEIGRAIYGQRVAGVPPSLVAELYWNFHLPGVLVGAFGFGLFLRLVQERFQAVRGGDPMRAALFAAGPMILGFEAVGSSLGSGVFRAALQTAVMLVLLFLVRERQPPGQPS